jgi:hypothetical protein
MIETILTINCIFETTLAHVALLAQKGKKKHKPMTFATHTAVTKPVFLYT